MSVLIERELASDAAVLPASRQRPASHPRGAQLAPGRSRRQGVSPVAHPASLAYPVRLPQQPARPLVASRPATAQRPVPSTWELTDRGLLVVMGTFATLLLVGLVSAVLGLATAGTEHAVFAWLR